MKKEIICFEFKMNNGDIWQSDAEYINGNNDAADKIYVLQNQLSSDYKLMTIKVLEHTIVLMKENISSVKVIRHEIDSVIFKKLKSK